MRGHPRGQEYNREPDKTAQMGWFPMDDPWPRPLFPGLEQLLYNGRVAPVGWEC